MGFLLGRDEIFWRLGHEKSDDLLIRLRNLENVNFQDETGISYLFMACSSHYLEAIMILLENGADPNLTDSSGREPILAAIGQKSDNNAKILEAFLNYGLDVNRIKGGGTLKELIQSFEDESLNDVLKKFM
ncbi:MAG: hypothetical protein E7511_05290 [Ruminococcus sp.]|nr:hypothetical protein [Ruminococcus sp.]